MITPAKSNQLGKTTVADTQPGSLPALHTTFAGWGPRI